MVVRREGPGVGKVAAMLDGIDGLQGKVGWLESATYPDGTPVAYVATIHEFGAPSQGIPPRPFMRPAVQDHGQQWLDLLRQGAARAAQGGISGRDVLEMVVLRAAGDVARKIQAVTAPGLKDATVKRKGFAKPLVDTGQMIQSVTGKVESE